VLALVVWGTAVYQRSLHAPFIFDDYGSIVDNPHIRTLWPLTDAMSAPPHQTVSQRPVVSLSFAINYALGGLDVRGYHAVNIASHILCALLLFGVIRCTLASQRLAARWGASSTPVAFAVALLWMVHPLETEAVAYVVQRTELFMSMFFLAALYCAIRNWQSETAAWRWVIPAGVACALGMASKQNTAACPIVVLLFDRAFFSGSFAAAWRKHKALHLMLAATWLILLPLVISDTRQGSVGYTLIGPWVYLCTQASVIVHYMQLAAWPSPLSISYNWPWAWSFADCVVPFALVAAMVMATVYGVVRNRWWAVAGATFFLILAPTSSILPIVTEPVAERRMHLPLAAVISMVLLLLIAHIRKTRTFHAALLACTVALASLMSAKSLARLAEYDTTLSIWTAAMNAYPNHPPNPFNVGVALLESGNAGGAMSLFERAIAINPRYDRAWIAIGEVHQRRKAYDDARIAYEKAIEINPGEPKAWSGLAEVYQQTRDLPRAIDAMKKAVEVALIKGPRLNNLGLLYEQADNLDDAIAAFQDAIAIEPLVGEYHMNLGVALDRADRTEEAIDEFQIAVQRSPDNVEAWENLTALLIRLRRFDEAFAACREAVVRDVRSAQVLNTFGGLLVRQGRLGEAIAQFESALRLDPDYPAAEHNLMQANEAMHNRRMP